MYERVNPGHSTTTQESSQCTDLPPVPAARQLGLAADSDRPQAEAAKARSGPERVLPSYRQSGPPAGLVDKLSQFFDDILVSALMDQLGEYSTAGLTIGHGKRTGTATITSPTFKHTVTDGAGSRCQ